MESENNKIFVGYNTQYQFELFRYYIQTMVDEEGFFVGFLCSRSKKSLSIMARKSPYFPYGKVFLNLEREKISLRDINNKNE